MIVDNRSRFELFNRRRSRDFLTVSFEAFSSWMMSSKCPLKRVHGVKTSHYYIYCRLLWPLSDIVKSCIIKKCRVIYDFESLCNNVTLFISSYSQLLRDDGYFHLLKVLGFFFNFQCELKGVSKKKMGEKMRRNFMRDSLTSGLDY